MWSLSTRQRWAGPSSLSTAPGCSYCTQVPRLATAPGTTPHGSPPGLRRSTTTSIFPASARSHDPGSAANHRVPIPFSKPRRPPPQRLWTAPSSCNSRAVLTGTRNTGQGERGRVTAGQAAPNNPGGCSQHMGTTGVMFLHTSMPDSKNSFPRSCAS